MSKIVYDVWKILKITIKPRQDSYSDQFSRIILMKTMLIGAFFTGISWYTDEIKCIIPHPGGKPFVDPNFVSQSCWINGIYVYEEIRSHDNELGYYGLPRDIGMNGKYPKSDVLCDFEDKKAKNCEPMTKMFFTQFQYMTFFLSAMAALYYTPYILFKFVNADMASLKAAIKGKQNKIKSTFYVNITQSSKSLKIAV